MGLAISFEFLDISTTLVPIQDGNTTKKALKLDKFPMNNHTVLYLAMKLNREGSINIVFVHSLGEIGYLIIFSCIIYNS